MKKALYFRCVYLYLFLPFFVWLLGWVKPIFAYPMMMVLFICLYRMIKKPDQHEPLKWDKKEKE